MSTYVIDGQELHIRDNRRNAPVALLIHGWSSSWFTWTPLLQALGTRYSYMAVDLPGYGRSPAPKHPITIEWYADLMAKLIEEASDRPVVVLGHSMGGQIAMTLALRHPMLVERLILLNPVVSGRLSTFINLFVAPHILLERTRLGGKILSYLENTPLSYINQLMKPILFAERAAISQQDYDRIRADARRPGQGAVRAACYEAMKMGDLRGKLKQIQPPAQVIWGAEDNTVPLRDAGAVADEWTEADLRLIPNAGHWPHFEQYETTMRYIASFLGLPILPSLPNAQVQQQRDLDVGEIAQFLSNTELGQDLSESQRMRVAGLCHQHHFAPQDILALEDSSGDELFIVQDGQVDVLVRISNELGIDESRRVNVLMAGQIAGEMALIQGKGGRRTADLRAGKSGATVLSIDSRYLFALFEDDASLGLKLMQNLARSLVQRLRVQNWQLQLAEQRAEVHR
ncbi:alpha/beta fold hydrolase [Herpetosiphon giganteus]|uniref:alpha/beta fold hydrolase n=1 Tax=Herpetosiphon giganteus TaxID=2029754 RepID=UPI00195CDF44|nr:alpha/beta fold hydrolase [Herpetosiphon giganteus]MBM7841917.1 pimeloyl-ACP methyl ester carboxylesterase/CRP-like cAMP-binding protein [Herpetosiphon giganteus]